MNNDTTVVPVEEAAIETAALADINEDEIRTQVITEYGFDEATDGERIEKLTLKEVEHRKKLSQAIGQKRKYRDLAAKPKEEVKPVAQRNDDISFKDAMVIMKADVAEEDVEEVVEYAKFKKISISDALKSPTIQATLATKTEQRKMAEAANTGNNRRTVAKVSAEDLIAAASKGKVPESDEDMKKLIDARHDMKKKK